MNKLQISVLPILVALLAVVTMGDRHVTEEGGFQLTASLPGAASVYGEAALVVTTRNCAEPKNATVTARLVVVENDAITSRTMKLRKVGEGEYAIDKQWADGVVAVIAIDGAYERQSAGLLIGLNEDATFEGSGRWVGRLTNGYPTRLLDRNVRDGDLQDALARMTD